MVCATYIHVRTYILPRLLCVWNVRMCINVCGMSRYVECVWDGMRVVTGVTHSSSILKTLLVTLWLLEQPSLGHVTD